MNATIQLLAGLTLFIFGMNTMGSSLQVVAGAGLRNTLERVTASRFRGMVFGSVLGFLVHSSAGSVMLIGFISAGLMTFLQSIPVIFGINIGTTLSMLMVSLRIGDACWLAIFTGLLIRVLHPRDRGRYTGLAVFGFGLIFLGMIVMSEAIRPYRDELVPLLTYADGTTLRGMLTGVVLATMVTAVIQSSGAVIAMVFAMISAGVITELAQAWPIILGANVGTCATALLGSIKASRSARECAFSHLFFNIYSAVLGILVAPSIYVGIPILLGSPTFAPGTPAFEQSLIYQCAVANALKMVFSAIIFLPAIPVFAKIITRLTPGTRIISEMSLLDDRLLCQPEDSLKAALHELARIARLCQQNLERQTRLFEHWSATRREKIKQAEEALDTLKPVIHDYLDKLARYPLSRRQSIFLSLLYTMIDHFERVSDHIDHLALLTQRLRRFVSPSDIAGIQSHFKAFNDELVDLIQGVPQAFFDSEKKQHTTALSLIDRCHNFEGKVDKYVTEHMRQAPSHPHNPMVSLYQTDYLFTLKRIARHIMAVATASSKNDFFVKTKKLGRIVDAL